MSKVAPSISSENVLAPELSLNRAWLFPTGRVGWAWGQHHHGRGPWFGTLGLSVQPEHPGLSETSGVPVPSQAGGLQLHLQPRPTKLRV